MEPIKLATLLAPTLALQGCFAVFIPGSVIDSASDAFSGAEGKNCVGQNAKVGDNIRLQDGTIEVVKSLSGPSNRCKEPTMPIRALLVLPAGTGGASQTPITSVISAQSNLGLKMPPGWESKPIPPANANGEVILYALNRTIDTGLLLSGVRKESITDLQTFAGARRANQINRLTDPHSTDILETVVSGKKAYRFAVTGSLKSGLKLVYSVTLVQGDAEIAVLTAWTAAANFEQQRAAIEDLADNVTGL